MTRWPKPTKILISNLSREKCSLIWKKMTWQLLGWWDLGFRWKTMIPTWLTIQEPKIGPVTKIERLRITTRLSKYIFSKKRTFPPKKWCVILILHWWMTCTSRHFLFNKTKLALCLAGWINTSILPPLTMLNQMSPTVNHLMQILTGRSLSLNVTQSLFWEHSVFRSNSIEQKRGYV